MGKALKDTAGNERFGASGAVTRPKVCATLEVYRPSERQWKPRLRQAAGTLSASGGDSAVDNDERLEKKVQSDNAWTMK